MTAQEYIQLSLEDLAKPIEQEDIGNVPLEEAIFAKVMSKKFRKLKVDQETADITRSSIKHAIDNNKPLKVGLLFGGNKLWRFDEAPEVDWAELFSLTYYLKWMKTISSVYEHGAEFEYFSQDVSVDRLNNVSPEDAEEYSRSFKAMLEWTKQYWPDRVTVGYKRQVDSYKDISEYEVEIEEAKKLVLADNNGELPKLSDAQKLATELNVRLRPGQDEDPLWREKVELEHQALFRTKTLTPYLHDTTIIPTCPTPYDGLIATGSTKKSIAKFWAGVGVLEKSGDSYNELVLTPKQLETADFKWEEVNFNGLEGKNFKKVRVVEGK